ncbi:MFS transporter [Clostridium rectalis]|uniref:MFS transporter n=1 Tax=Clostridium rectalis TaxID=2040295 RepID=UPI000F64226A|nr:MFS transporter [Clostridium rectalis]
MDKKNLKNKSFICFILGVLVSKIGTEIQAAAFSVYVMELTGSTKAFGFILALSIIPKIVCAPIFMTFIDNLNPKKVVYGVDMFNGLFLLFIFIYSEFYTLGIGSIICINIILAVTITLFSPASNTLIPLIVERDNLVKANSINSVVTSVAQILGPILGIYLFEVFGIKIIVLVNGISFVISSISEMFITCKEKNVESKKRKISFKSSIIELYDYIKDQKSLKKILIINVFLNFIVSPMLQLGTIHIVKVSLNLPNMFYSIFESILVAAILLGSILSIKISNKYQLTDIFKRLIYITTICFIIAAITINGSIKIPSIYKFVSILIVFSLIAIAISLFNVIFMALLQSEINISILGRISLAIQVLSMSSIPLGQIFFGYLLEELSTSIVFIISAILCYVPYKLSMSKPNLKKS